MMKNFNYRITLAIALAAALAATGCVHRPYGVTPIPHRPTEVADQNPYGTMIQQEPPVQPGPGVGTQPLPEPPAPAGDVLDHTALAAYSIHFSFDSAVIRDSEKAKLQQVAAALNADPTMNLMIEGNCDERGTEEYNRSLGERRAEAAREALVGMGIDSNRIHTISYGKDKPVDTGHDESAWSQNRRDDFAVMHPKPGA
ncbi:MAG TPA: peptidoglycan-associated lipoprotein Pal [Alphaproteobacteria bacterium]|nr:peptidoglycan-associated lipoprotein Pal [Alphaproteobacteria bacterium]